MCSISRISNNTWLEHVVVSTIKEPQGESKMRESSIGDLSPLTQRGSVKDSQHGRAELQAYWEYGVGNELNIVDKPLPKFHHLIWCYPTSEWAGTCIQASVRILFLALFCELMWLTEILLSYRGHKEPRTVATRKQSSLHHHFVSGDSQWDDDIWFITFASPLKTQLSLSTSFCWKAKQTKNIVGFF